MPLTPEQAKRVRDLYEKQIAKDAAASARRMAEEARDRVRKTFWQRVKAWFK